MILGKVCLIVFGIILILIWSIDLYETIKKTKGQYTTKDKIFIILDSFIIFLNALVIVLLVFLMI